MYEESKYVNYNRLIGCKGRSLNIFSGQNEGETET